MTEKTRTTTIQTQRFGAMLSLLCAIHCALMPILMATLPLAGSALADSHFLEGGLILISVALALYGIFRNYKAHPKFDTAIWLVLGGVVAILAAHFVLPEALEWVIMPVGGILIAAGQIKNIRRARHKHNASCAH